MKRGPHQSSNFLGDQAASLTAFDGIAFLERNAENEKIAKTAEHL